VKTFTTHIRKNTRALIALFLITIFGLSSKLYPGPGSGWVNNSFSGVFYEIFWCILVYFLFNRAKAWKIAAGVLVITCLLELSQLYRNSLLDAVRGNFIGRALIGNSFSWYDYPYYFLGCGIGWYLIMRLQKAAARDDEYA
jgi:hypothetical protein